MNSTRKASALDRKLLLNRETHARLVEAGLGQVATQALDPNAARRLGLWRSESGGRLYLLGLLTAATRHMALRYLEQQSLEVDLTEVKTPDKQQKLPELDTTFSKFLACYPLPALEIAAQPGKRTQLKATARKQLVAELYLLDTLLDNPALTPYRDMFDDAAFRAQSNYRVVLQQITAVTVTTAEAGSLCAVRLPELLRQPIQAAPHNLLAQISFAIKHWTPWLPETLRIELQTARAIAEEEETVRLPGPGPTPQPLFGQGDGSDLPAAFTEDTEWMSSSVLLAKSIFVWLDQLSQRFQRPIHTLYDIPEEELKRLGRWGFNALWLIGIWERSSASRKIKQLRGNPEAEASAYALHAYRVTAELGGEEALHNLESRCRRHGIRLACDVVPNHTGIDSEWVREHPDWFLQTDQPPWPNYQFTGPDLCEDAEISLRIEDGYWDHSDAAVVCEHLDHRSGQKRYLYHGNDGTHMPWNDTAQLNFLLPEVRQAMSDLIVSVAKRFSLIRFDAAMTLARKHFRRLWFPPPGGSAGVPSRSEFWMSDQDFAAAFPVEFWREVVDRINQEAPDTLLIAEAFWLMESYFVRNLGMHRVYNSAFMNMLKREENAKYRRILKDTLAYNPEIMKRYVNFMNNPDEATAVEQFDKGDKYFGVATLLATLPGLPMFGHGQVEGFKEKYGMEYRRAYWDETPDLGFVEHHERQIFPLLRRRWLFAGVEDFSLYDFTTAGDVDDNVYAFSNGRSGQKHLVVFNNGPHHTTGRLHQAAPKANPDNEGVAQPMPPLWQELGLDPAAGKFCRFQDQSSGQEYLCRTDTLGQGLELHLSPYQHHVFHNFSLLQDEDNYWQELHHRLAGRPVANLDLEMLRLRYAALWQSFTSLLNPARLQVLCGGLSAQPLTKPTRRLLNDIFAEINAVATEIRRCHEAAERGGRSVNLTALMHAVPQWLSTQAPQTGLPHKLLSGLWNSTAAQPGVGVAVLGWLILHATGKVAGLDNDLKLHVAIQDFGLDHAWQEAARSRSEQEDIAFTLLLLQTAGEQPHPALDQDSFAAIINDHRLRPLLGINRHQDTEWFSKEQMTKLVGSLAVQAGIQLLLRDKSSSDATEISATIHEAARRRLARAAAVGYRLDKFLHLG